MKFARFTVKENEYVGVVKEQQVTVIQGDMFSDWTLTETVFPLSEVNLLAPVVPSKIVGIGANFVGAKADLPADLPEIPVFFFKPTSSLVGPETDVVIPNGIDEVKFESELAVVIGKEMKNVAKEDVLDYVFGYTVGNDVTAPQFFHEAGHWTVGKAFDSFTPLGPVIETELDPYQVSVKADINGAQKQNSPTELMIVPIREMIAYLSNVMTLVPGDVILTGSPLGAHFIKDGDTVECKIDEIGVLRNKTVKVSETVKS